MPHDLVARIDKIAVHPQTATGAVGQRKGRLDMRLLLAGTGSPLLPDKEAALADPRRGHIRLIRKLAFSASMKPKIIEFPLSRRMPRFS